jgi:hypothetical protein
MLITKPLVAIPASRSRAVALLRYRLFALLLGRQFGGGLSAHGIMEIEIRWGDAGNEARSAELLQTRVLCTVPW